MIRLRITELIKVHNLSLEQLAQLTGIAIDTLEKYSATEGFNPQDPDRTVPMIGRDIKELSSALSVKPLELIYSENSDLEGVEFKIPEIAKAKDISFEKLCGDSGIHPFLVTLYSTQVFPRHYLSVISNSPDIVDGADDKDAEVKQHLRQISNYLSVSPSSLASTATIPKVKLSLEKLESTKGLSSALLGGIHDVPDVGIEILKKYPFNIPDVIDLCPDTCCQHNDSWDDGINRHFLTICDIIGDRWMCKSN